VKERELLCLLHSTTGLVPLNKIILGQKRIDTYKVERKRRGGM
jgi:hypothetical protein